MSNTPPKFRISDTASETDPTVSVAEAWKVFDATYLANRPGIVSVIHGVMAQGFKNWAAGNNQPFNEPLILEKALTKAHPEFMIATQGLKKSVR